MMTSRWMETVRTTMEQDTQNRRDQTAEGGSRRRGNQVKSELSSQTPLNSTFREGSSGRPPRGPAVAVTTQEALEGSREKTMRIANAENNALNWVSISSGGALDMTLCDCRGRPARDKMRHIIGSSEPEVIIGSDRDRNRGAGRRTRITQNFCVKCTRHRLRAADTSCTS